MQQAVLERHELKADLEQALRDGDLFLHYQPIVALDSQNIDSVEALVRWNHRERGPMPPMTFIPLAEETGLIMQLGEWVLREACRQVRAWHDEHPNLAPLSLNVNVSSRQLQCTDMVEVVAAVLRDTGLPATSLIVEITESVLLQDVSSAVRTLDALRSLGVRVAIDDFGTGYSSLGYLRQLPIDIVKVDRAFVASIGEGREDRSLTFAIKRLLDTIDVETTAEGIETEQQLAYVGAMGFDHGQGYLFSRPLAAEQMSALLETGVRIEVAA
jgi:EAL domain-containing protein (putative c-di-GMP-specific phosphodiesterase class I)